MKLKRCITLNILLFLIGMTCSVEASTVHGKPFTIVIDAGHGGNDPGASYFNVKEKNVVLAVATKLGKLINQDIPDVKLVYTRKSDVFIPLHERAQKAIDAKADLFVSLHANSCATPSIKGAETYVLGMHRTEENLEVAKKENSVILIESDYNTRYEGFDPNSSESYIMFDLVQQQYFDQSIKMAALVQNSVRDQAARNDRGVKQAGFLVLRQTSMPSVLIEIGYLSNPDEAKYLNSAEGQDELASSICSAIKNYKASYENKSDFAITASNGNASQTSTTPSNTYTEKKQTKQEATKDTIKEQIVAQKPENKQQATVTDKTVTVQPKQQPAAPADPKQQKNNSTQKAADSSFIFRIQIAATHKQLELKPYNFRGLTNVEYFKMGDVYKYYYGKTSSYDEANALKNKAQTVYPDAFIVAFEGDKIIPLKEALSRLVP